MESAMSDINVNCCGSKCRDPHGEVRVYPLGGGANLILCHACWTHENSYRRMRQRNYMLGSPYHVDDSKRAEENWPQHNWDEAEKYENQ